MISAISADLLIAEQRKKGFTCIYEFKQINMLLQTIESKLPSFSQFLPRLGRRRALLNLGGTILKYWFGTAVDFEVQELYTVFDKLNSRNSDLLHSVNDQLSYVKKLYTVAAANAEAITNLSNIVKNNIVKSHDKFQGITRDILYLNLTIFGQSEMYMAVRQLEFVLSQLILQLENLLTAIQCIILGNFPIKLSDPATLQIILRNVTLNLPDGYELIAGTKTEDVHLYFQIARVSMIANAHYMKLIINIPLKPPT